MQKPNNKLYLMNYIFNEILDHVSKKIWSFVHFNYRGFVYKQGTIGRRILIKIETESIN